jgi:hypothetical protein
MCRCSYIHGWQEVVWGCSGCMLVDFGWIVHAGCPMRCSLGLESGAVLLAAGHQHMSTASVILYAGCCCC